MTEEQTGEGTKSLRELLDNEGINGVVQELWRRDFDRQGLDEYTRTDFSARRHLEFGLPSEITGSSSVEDILTRGNKSLALQIRDQEADSESYKRLSEEKNKIGGILRLLKKGERQEARQAIEEIQEDLAGKLDTLLSSEFAEYRRGTNIDFDKKYRFLPAKISPLSGEQKPEKLQIFNPDNPFSENGAKAIDLATDYMCLGRAIKQLS